MLHDKPKILAVDDVEENLTALEALFAGAIEGAIGRAGAGIAAGA